MLTCLCGFGSSNHSKLVDKSSTFEIMFKFVLVDLLDIKSSFLLALSPQLDKLAKIFIMEEIKITSTFARSF